MNSEQNNSNVRRFTIDSEGKLRILTAADEDAGSAGLRRFHSARQFEAIANSWPSSRFVRIWNQLPSVKPVKKFTDRKTAVTRIWNAIQTFGAGDNQPVKRVADTANANVDHSTKTDQILSLLQQPAGASLQELMTATGWQAHTVRGFLSRQVRKKLRLRLKSFLRNGERICAVSE